MCILLNVKKHEKTFALNVDIFMSHFGNESGLTWYRPFAIMTKVM